MTRHFRLGLHAGVAAALLAASPVLAEDTTIRGVVAAHEGNTITVKAQDGTMTKVMLSPDTSIRSMGGAANVRRRDAQQSSLVPGLPVEVRGTAGADGIAANRVQFRTSDVRTAHMIAGGVNPTAQQANANSANIAANRDQLDRLGNAEIIKEATVLFATGSTAISAEGRTALLDLAARAKTLNGWGVEVTGFADATGDPARNKVLSDRRAEAVSRFLRTTGGLPSKRVHAGAGKGVPDDAPAGAHAESRRVVARLYVDKGVTQPK